MESLKKGSYQIVTDLHNSTHSNLSSLNQIVDSWPKDSKESQNHKRFYRVSKGKSTGKEDCKSQHAHSI